MSKYTLRNHKNSGFYPKPMSFDTLKEARKQWKYYGGQLIRHNRDGSADILRDERIGWETYSEGP